MKFNFAENNAIITAVLLGRPVPRFTRPRPIVEIVVPAPKPDSAAATNGLHVKH
jgi:hypothetical protein